MASVPGVLDFIVPYILFNVQSATLAHPLWTSAYLNSASTSNPPLLLIPFGLPRAVSPLQRPIHHDFLLLLDFCHASHSFNVQSVTLSCSFWTSTCLPPPQRPILHASKPHLPPHNHKLLTTQKSNTSTSVPALLYIF